MNIYIYIYVLLNIQDFRNYKVSIDKISDSLNFIPLYKPIDTINEILKNIDIESYDFNNEQYYNIKTFKKVI